MPLSNRDRLGKALDQLCDGMRPDISHQLEDNLGSDRKDRLPHTCSTGKPRGYRGTHSSSRATLLGRHRS